MGPEQTGTLAVAPQVEFVPLLRPAQRAALHMEDERLTRQILARDRDAADHAPRVDPRPGQHTRRLTPQHGEPPIPCATELPAHFRTDARPAGPVSPGPGRCPETKVQRLRQVHILLPREGIEVLEHLEAHALQFQPGPYCAEARTREWHGRRRSEILAAPGRSSPQAQVARRTCAECHPPRDADAELPVL